MKLGPLNKPDKRNKAVKSLYKSTIWSCMKDFCHYTPSCYLEMLDKLQKEICRVVGPLHATSFALEPFAHCQNITSWSLFYRYYFSRYSSELAQLVPLPYSRVRSTNCRHRLDDFSVTICRCYKDVKDHLAQLELEILSPESAFLWPMI